MAQFETTDVTYPARRVVKTNNNGNPIVLSAGQGIRLQSGEVGSPATEVQYQVPANKQAEVETFIIVTETAA